MRMRLAVVAVAAVGLLAGCASVVDGSGTTALTPGSSGGSGPAAQVATPCQHVVYPHAKLSFDCFTTGFTPQYNGDVWPLRESKTVEASTGWVVEEGAGHWGSADGESLGDIAANVRQRMVTSGGYGDGPSFATSVDKDLTVNGAKAHLLQTTFTVNPAWAKQSGTKVKHEILWIVALQVGTNDVSLWYASVPDLAKSLWPKVPAAIDSIRVG
jgi:hypothetical protein